MSVTIAQGRGGRMTASFTPRQAGQIGPYSGGFQVSTLESLRYGSGQWYGYSSTARRCTDDPQATAPHVAARVPPGSRAATGVARDQRFREGVGA